MKVKDLVERMEIVIYSEPHAGTYVYNINCDKITVNENCSLSGSFAVIHSWNGDVKEKEILELYV